MSRFSFFPILLFIIVFNFLQIKGTDLGIGCARWGTEGMFNLMPLSKSDGNYYSAPEIGLKFNLCKKLTSPCGKQNVDTPATIETNSSGCSSILGSDDPSYNDTYQNGTTLVTVYFSNGDRCSSTQNYTLKLLLTCDSSVSSSSAQFQLLSNPGSCDIVLSTSAEAACPMFSLGWMLDQYFSVFALLFLAAGLFMTFLGSRLFKVVLFILGGIAVAGIFLMFMYEIVIPTTTGKWAFWAVLLFSLGIGAISGYYIFKFHRYCFFLAGGYLGFMLAIFSYNFILYKIIPQSCYQILIYSSIVAFAVLNFYMKDNIIILSTSVTGAYMTIRGISLFIGGFPSEVKIFDLVKQEKYDELPWSLHIYLGLMIFWAIFGISVQCRYQQEVNDVKLEYARNYKELNDIISV